MVMGWMETFEDLAITGFKPNRTIYLAVGADEEVGKYAVALLCVVQLASERVSECVRE